MNMKKRIALGSALLLTLGTAVAGTLMYGHEPVDSAVPVFDTVADSAPTPETIEMWKATASSADTLSLKRPI